MSRKGNLPSSSTGDMLACILTVYWPALHSYSYISKHVILVKMHPSIHPFILYNYTK